MKKPKLMTIVAILCATTLVAFAHGTMTTVYKGDTKSCTYKVIPSEQLPDAKAQGMEPTLPAYDSTLSTPMYSDDGRVAFFNNEICRAQSTVGWYYSPKLRMYAADGRTRMTLFEQIPAYENVNWYIEPPARMVKEGNMSSNPKLTNTAKRAGIQQNFQIAYTLSAINLKHSYLAKKGNTEYI